MVGSGVTTNNELVKAYHSKEDEEVAFIVCCNGGVGRELIHPIIKGRPCNHREH